MTTSASAVIPVDDLTFWEVCERRARLTPDRLMIADERDRRITFGEFRDRAQRVAAGLHQLGIGPGSRVSWQLPTRIETLLVCLALARLGAHQNPVIPAVRGREVGFALRQTGAEWVVLPGTWNGFDYAEMVSGLDWSHAPRPRIVVVGVDDLPDGDPATLPPPPTDPRQARWTFYTSGTTSEPKGVLHSDESLMWGGRGYAERMRLDADTVFAMQFAIAHIGGPNLFCFVFSVRIRTLSVERFDPSSLAELFRRHRVNLCGGSVTFGELLLREQRRRGGGRMLPDLRQLGGGAGPTPPAMFDQITAELGVTYTPAYGMTEVPMIAVGDPDDDVELRRGTDGAPVRGIEIRAARLDGTVADPGEEGELQIRGPQVCQGYRVRRRPRRRSSTAGYAPATWEWSARSAGSRTSSSARARTFPRGRSRTCSAPTRRWPGSPWSACPTTNAASGSARWWSGRPASPTWISPRCNATCSRRASAATSCPSSSSSPTSCPPRARCSRSPRPRCAASCSPAPAPGPEAGAAPA